MAQYSNNFDMAHYIDADRLRAEIKHLKIDVYDEAHQFDIGARAGLTFLESFIDSLQQEQPKFNIQSNGSAAWGMTPPKVKLEVKEQPVEGLEEAAENIYKTPFGTRAEDFKAGAEWMAGQGWISVDEKLPETDEEVIVLTDELGTAPIYKISFGHIVDVERCIDYNGWNIPGVKCWMPCPEIPNND